VIIFCEEKLEWWGNQLVKKFEDKLSGFHTIHECDGQTELQIDRQPAIAWWHRPHLCIALCKRKVTFTMLIAQ